MSRILTKQEQLEAFSKLGALMQSPDAELKQLIETSHVYNAWFTPLNTEKAITSIGYMLNKTDLEEWFNQWQQSEENKPQKIGLILAGNIPLVGFHDVLCVLAAGHIALIKLSSQDQKLIPYLLNKLISIAPAYDKQVQFVEKLEGFDAVIATGSNNSSRYFEYYFSKVPHVIRKNRNSVAVLTGAETTAQLEALGADIFDYFGLGCRNVSKLYVPMNYIFDPFFEALEKYREIIHHYKYHNNYDYNKSILLVNRAEHLDNGFLLVKKDERLSSPLAVIHYEEYNDLADVTTELEQQKAEIQCVVTSSSTSLSSIPFGEAQHPKLWDYADGIDTMQFLTALN